MKNKDFIALSDAELKKKLNELHTELMRERANKSMGKYSQNTSRIRVIRRMIAKIMTKLSSGGSTEQ